MCEDNRKEQYIEFWGISKSKILELVHIERQVFMFDKVLYHFYETLTGYLYCTGTQYLNKVAQKSPNSELSYRSQP